MAWKFGHLTSSTFRHSPYIFLIQYFMDINLTTKLLWNDILAKAHFVNYQNFLSQIQWKKLIHASIPFVKILCITSPAFIFWPQWTCLLFNIFNSFVLIPECFYSQEGYLHFDNCGILFKSLPKDIWTVNDVSFSKTL